MNTALKVATNEVAELNYELASLLFGLTAEQLEKFVDKFVYFNHIAFLFRRQNIVTMDGCSHALDNYVCMEHAIMSEMEILGIDTHRAGAFSNMFFDMLERDYVSQGKNLPVINKWQVGDKSEWHKVVNHFASL